MVTFRLNCKRVLLFHPPSLSLSLCVSRFIIAQLIRLLALCNVMFTRLLIIIIIMVIFKCYFSGELIALT